MNCSQKLENLLAEVPDHYDGWLALTEVQLARRDLDAALEAGEKSELWSQKIYTFIPAFLASG